MPDMSAAGAPALGGVVATARGAVDGVCAAAEAMLLLGATDGAFPPFAAGGTGAGAGASLGAPPWPATDGEAEATPSVESGVVSGARLTTYRTNVAGSITRKPSSSSSIENPVVSMGSPRRARAAWSAGCHWAASTTHCSAGPVGFPDETSMNQRIVR
jgi:hypothetical protein